jgi:hypothetical protein
MRLGTLSDKLCNEIPDCQKNGKTTKFYDYYYEYERMYNNKILLIVSSIVLFMMIPFYLFVLSINGNIFDYIASSFIAIFLFYQLIRQYYIIKKRSKKVSDLKRTYIISVESKIEKISRERFEKLTRINKKRVKKRFVDKIKSIIFVKNN